MMMKLPQLTHDQAKTVAVGKTHCKSLRMSKHLCSFAPTAVFTRGDGTLFLTEEKGELELP